MYITNSRRNPQLQAGRSSTKIHGEVPSRGPTPYLFIYQGGGGGDGETTPYSGLGGEAVPERGTFFKLQVYERVGISLVVVG